MRKLERDFHERSLRKLGMHDIRRGRRILRGIRRIFTRRGGRLTEFRPHHGRDAVVFVGAVQGQREGTYLTAQDWVEWRGVPSRMIACAERNLQVAA